MDPVLFLLLVALVAAGGVGTSYLAHDRTYRATRGALGAAQGGWTSGRAVASSAFSRPPARSQTGSSLGADLGWLLRQGWHTLRVGGHVVHGSVVGFRDGRRSAQVRIDDGTRPTVSSVRARIPNARLPRPRLPRRLLGRERGPNVDGTPTSDELPRVFVPDGHTFATDEEGYVYLLDPYNNVVARDMPASDHPADLALTMQWLADHVTPRPARSTTPTTNAASAAQNGAPMTEIADVLDVDMPSEFENPGQMEEAVDLLRASAETLIAAQQALVEGLERFINAYAEAKFTTGALNDAVGALVESVDEDGVVNVGTFVERLPGVDEAVAEAKTLGEHGTEIEAEGDVTAFRES